MLRPVWRAMTISHATGAAIMKDVRDRIRNQRGVALVAAMLVLVFLSLLVTALIVSITVETKIAGRTTRADKALNTAEAGIAEALERIRKGDVPDNSNPKMVTQIFLAQAGSVPTLGADSIALPTWQEHAGWLTYSTPTRSPDVLTVTYRTDAARTKIFRYDATKNPAIQAATGRPIFVVSCTGRYADARRSVVSEVIEPGIETFCKGAVVAAKKIRTAKESWLCGYNHRLDTPTWTNIPDGRDGKGNACNDDPKQKKWELGSDDITGAWAGKKIDGLDKKGAGVYGSPSDYLQNQSGFYNGPWEILGMTQSEYFAMLGPAVKNVKKLKDNIDGIHYYDPDGKKGKKGGKLEIKNGEGEGLLYVDGDLNIKGKFVYRGLIYATGRITFDGRTWVLGCVVSGKDLRFHAKNKECAVLYSHDAIADAIGQYGAPFVTLSWREKP
jgi:Tfp pilus assembly protein PilX